MDILNQSFYLVTNGGFPLIRVHLCAKLLIIKHSLTPAPHTDTPVCEIINYQTFAHPPPPTHTHLCAKLLIIKHSFTPPPTGVRGGGRGVIECLNN